MTAFNRFGFGARPGDLDAAAGDPRGLLLEELWTADVALIRDRVPPPGLMAFEAYYLDQQKQRAARMKIAMAASPPAAAAQVAMTCMAAPPPGDPTALTKTADLSAAPTAPVSAMTPAPTGAPSSQSMAPHEGKPPAKPEPPKPPLVEQELFRHEAEARLRNQLQARVGFVERLVAFWSNHFAVSVAKSNELRVAAGPFEREAIRPNVLGKLGALLRAAESHPAMILYLDNQNSIGPDAAPGKFAGRGLNEDLAREILELHTLGVGSGYSQADVIELARILTGWSVAGPDSEAGQPGAFLFKPNWHEPGVRRFLGKTYAENGVDQGHAALDDLVRHPATARHIATKLVRHFVADNPPADLVEALARRFLDSDGNLAVVASALVCDDRAWIAKPTKIRTPSSLSLRRRACRAFSRKIRTSISKVSTCSACRCGNRAVRTVFPMRATLGPRPKA